MAIKETLARQLGILAYIHDNFIVSISELARHFEVTPETIKSDLSTLEFAGDSINPNISNFSADVAFHKLITFNNDWLKDGDVELRDGLGVEQFVTFGDLEVAELLRALNVVKQYINNPHLDKLISKLQNTVAILTENTSQSTRSEKTPMGDIPSSESIIQEAIINQHPITFSYKNQQRYVLPKEILMLGTSTHVEYYLRGLDISKNSERVFKIKEILNLFQEEKSVLTIQSETAQNRLQLELAFKPQYALIGELILKQSHRIDADNNYIITISVGNLEWFKSFLSDFSYALKYVKALDKASADTVRQMLGEIK